MASTCCVKPSSTFLPYSSSWCMMQGFLKFFASIMYLTAARVLSTYGKRLLNFSLSCGLAGSNLKVNSAAVSGNSCSTPASNRTSCAASTVGEPIGPTMARILSRSTIFCDASTIDFLNGHFHAVGNRNAPDLDRAGQVLVGTDDDLGGRDAFIGNLGLGCGRQIGQRKGAHRKAQRLERFRHCSLLFVGPR